MNILLIDDHPMIIQAYISCLSDEIKMEKRSEFTVASNCTDAFNIIDNIASNNKFDLALIDQSLPAFHEEKLVCGGDLALLLQKKNQNCKIIIITSHSEFIIIYNLLQKVAPNGFIIKNDVNAESLVEGVQKVLKGNTFYSCSVEKIMQEIRSKEIMLDDINRKIILYLSKGYKIKELEPIISLSVSAIKRRIAQMKEAFNTNEDNTLVKEAILQGFI